MTNTHIVVSVNGDIVAHEIMRMGLLEIVRKFRAEPLSFTAEVAAQMAQETLAAAEMQEARSAPGVARA